MEVTRGTTKYQNFFVVLAVQVPGLHTQYPVGWLQKDNNMGVSLTDHSVAGPPCEDLEGLSAVANNLY